MAYNSTSWTSDALSKAGSSITTTIIGASSTTIKIFPHHFITNDDSTALQFYAIEDDTSNYGIFVGNAACELYAYIDIPTGYSAKKVVIYSSHDDIPVEVYSLNLTDGTISGEISDSTLETNDTDKDLATPHQGANRTALFIKVALQSVSKLIYGGFVTIEQS